jgi:hypothetical protein
MAIPRRYLNEITTILRQVYDAYEEHIVYDDCPVYHSVVHHINSIFFNENPNYDPDKFLAGSGYDEYTSKLSNKDPRTQLQHTLTVLVRALGSLVRSPERMYVMLSLLTKDDGVIFLGYVNEATDEHEPCSDYNGDCKGECLTWLEERDEVITVRWFGCKFYFQVFIKSE